MGRVLTNNTGLQVGIEPSLASDPLAWKQLEPNGINQFGATIATVARNPISKRRQRRKGTITDLDSAVEFEADLTLDVFLDFMEGFAFSRALNYDMSPRSYAAVASTDAYTVLPLTAAQADKLEFSAAEYATLIYARGHTNADNNGLKQLDADIATSATAVTVAESLVEEASPPANARIELAGLRSLAGASDFTWNYDSGTETATLTSAGDIADFSLFGLSEGQMVHIGSEDTNGDITNAFGAAHEIYGYARIKSFGSGLVVFDKLDAALKFDDASAPTTAVDLLFGMFIRNVAVDDADFLERSFMFEAAWENLSNPSGDEYEYAKGNYCNQIQFNLALADKATVTLGFVGTDTLPPSATRKNGAGAAIAATGVLTMAGNAGNTQTVTIGSVTYTFQTVLVNSANNVLIGATASDSLDNLIAAINAGAGAGTLYGTGTVANPHVSALAGSGDTMNLTADVAGSAGNLIATTETLASGSFGAATLTGGYDASREALGTGAYNTSADIMRLRIQNVDDTGLTTDFKSCNLTVNNNVTSEKVLGQLGAKYINAGNLEVDIEAQVLFTDSDVPAAIRNNKTLTMDFVLRNGDGALCFDIPSLTIGGGDKELPVNESVLLNTTGQAFEDDVLDTSFGLSVLPYAPAPR